jgi:hypothetical protein
MTRIVVWCCRNPNEMDIMNRLLHHTCNVTDVHRLPCGSHKDSSSSSQAAQTSHMCKTKQLTECIHAHDRLTISAQG